MTLAQAPAAFMASPCPDMQPKVKDSSVTSVYITALLLNLMFQNQCFQPGVSSCIKSKTIREWLKPGLLRAVAEGDYNNIPC